MTIAEAARVGAELREARLALGASLEEVADELRINRRYIAALEEGRTEELPALVYALGFVRSYATALGLDADDLARRYRSVAVGGEAGPRAARRGGRAPAVMVVLGALVLAAGYAAWVSLGGTGDAAPPAPTAGVARLPTPGTPAPAAPAPEGGTARSAPPPPQAAAPRPAAPAEASSRVTLRATDETWVQVRDPASGATVLNRVLRAGESVAVPREGLALTAGKAQAVEVLLDGHATQALAGRTGLVRDVPLAPEGLRPARPAPGAPPAR